MKNFTNNSISPKSLQQWNDQIVLHLIPFILVLSVYLIFGVLGNSTVLFIYLKRFTNLTEGRYFIVVLAVIDLIACIVNCACHLSETIMPIMYNSDIGCKIERYMCMVTTAPSIFVLLLIVIDRYLKICKPLGKQMTRKHKRLSIEIIIMTVIVISLPCLMFFGSMPVVSEDGTLIGMKCVGVTGGFSHIAVIYNVSLLSIAVFVLLTMAVLYSKICKVIFKKAKFSMKSEKKNVAIHETSTNYFSADSQHVSAGISTVTIKNISVNQQEKDTSLTASKRQNQEDLANGKIRHWRITLIFIVITIAFAVSFIPKLAMMIIESIHSDFWISMSAEELGLYMFLYSVYIFNNFVNPFIYGFIDKKFQAELKKMCCCSSVS